MSKSIHSPINSPPTARQLSILAYIARCTWMRGWAPSLRELGKEFEIRSTNGVNDHLRNLERRGLLERQRLLARAMRVTSKGLELLDDKGMAP